MVSGLLNIRKYSMEDSWEDNPFKKKKIARLASNYEKLLKSADFVGTQWEETQEHIGMVFTIARRFSKVYQHPDLHDHLVSELLLYIPTIRQNYIPSMGEFRPYLSVSLGLKARTIWRHMQKQINKEYVTDFSEQKQEESCSYLMQEDDRGSIEASLDIQNTLKKLTAREAWLVHKRIVEELNIEDIRKNWNETHHWCDRQSFATIYRWTEAAVKRFKEEMNEKLL